MLRKCGSTGIDSIGGVRIPGAYCGVLAFRPSHAVVSSSGVIPVAPSLDTIGICWKYFYLVWSLCHEWCNLFHNRALNLIELGMAQYFISSIIGWFARDPSVLNRVGHLLLRLPYAGIRQPRIFYIADDCFELSKILARRLIKVVKKSVEKLFGSMCLLVLISFIISKLSGLFCGS
jgi:hypothetical protein